MTAKQCSRKALTSLLFLGVLSLVATSSAAQTTPADRDAVLDLTRSADLADWLGNSTTLDQSVCIQTKILPVWPRAQEGTLRSVELSRLRAAQEQCDREEHESSRSANAKEPKDIDRGLVSAQVANYQARLHRLIELKARVRECVDSSSNSEQELLCLNRVAGKTLSTVEHKKILLASAIRETP